MPAAMPTFHRFRILIATEQALLPPLTGGQIPPPPLSLNSFKVNFTEKSAISLVLFVMPSLTLCFCTAARGAFVILDAFGAP